MVAGWRGILVCAFVVSVTATAETTVVHAPSADSGASPSSGGAPAALDCSAIGRLIRANGNRIPRNLQEWSQAIGDHGEGSARQAIIPLSRAIVRGSLEDARKLLAPVPGDSDQGHPGRLNLSNRLFLAHAHQH